MAKPKAYDPNKAEALRRSVSMRADLAAWVSWYSTMSGRTVVSITDEALRRFRDAHAGDFPGGPDVTSQPLEHDDKRKRHDA